MKILLVGINAKYVQTNLAIRVLKSFCDSNLECVKNKNVEIEIAEWNINQQTSAIVRGIYESQADLILFSTYIWNREMVMKVAGQIKKVCPSSFIGFGGPEVSWSVERTFLDCPDATLIIAGEGELTLAEIITRIDESAASSLLDVDFSGIKGLVVRNVFYSGMRSPIENLDIIPFPYQNKKNDFDPATHIVYYESSRGCPFSCAYCISSIDKTVRYYSLERVFREIGFFLEEGYPLVKFVDRTFNVIPERYLSIWKFIRDNHNGKTLFHFEIAAEYLTEDAFRILDTMPEGSIQLEIGIQSINQETLKLVGRPAHPEILAAKIKQISKKIHIHVDLIAGLPAENLESFIRSFDYAFSLDADMLQLGFLKILAGSPMEAMARNIKGFVWTEEPPYEVLSTPDLSYADLLLLKDVEHVVDAWYNSGLMRKTLNQLALTSPRVSPFALFHSLGKFIQTYYSDGDLYLPRRTSDSFSCLAAFIKLKEGSENWDGQSTLEWLKFDYLMQGKPGTFPDWYQRRYSKEAHDSALEDQQLLKTNGASRRTVYSRTEFEIFKFRDNEEDRPVLFIYPEYNDKEKKVKYVNLWYSS